MSTESSAALRLRALAHPLRWKLIDLLDSEGSATATRCAEVLGESVASCSYHLGMLGKYGYIEPVPDVPGRERPWRLTERDQDLSPPGPDIEDVLAAEAAVEAFLEHEFSRITERVRRRSLEPEEWRQASAVGGSTMWVTADELRAIREQMIDVLRRFGERSEDPALRPPGARETRVFVSLSVAPEPPTARRNPDPPPTTEEEL